MRTSVHFGGAGGNNDASIWCVVFLVNPENEYIKLIFNYLLSGMECADCFWAAYEE